MIKFARNQVWLYTKHVCTGAQFFPREMLRLMFNVEYDNDIKAFVIRFTSLGLTLWLDIYFKPELMADLEASI